MKLTHSVLAHQDARGTIADILYQTPIWHVSVIDSVAGAIRGNHYHKATTQYMYLTQGRLRYWYLSAPLDPVQSVIVQPGDLVMTPPLEVHALEILEDTQFLVFTNGPRGGKDYESDTFRVPSILPEAR